MNLTPMRLRRSGAGVATGALVASALLFAPPANAATTVIVTGTDIAPTATPYAGWHQGAVNNGVPGKQQVTSEGLTLIGRSQVIKGFDNNSSTLDAKNLDLNSLDDASLDVTRGSVAFQVPIFFNSATKDSAFTTLRPEAAATGDTELDLDDNWISSGDVDATILKNTPTPLRDIIGALTDYKTIAFGVYSQAGVSSVDSISIGGTTYDFQAAAPAVATVVNADIAPNENTYAGWHQGYAKTPAGAQATAKGLELAGPSQIIKGYANNNNTLDTQNVNLTATLIDAKYTVSEGGATLQVPLFFNDGGTVRFTTLRSTDADGGPVDLGDDWVSSRAFGPIVKDAPTPLSDILDALGDSYKVIAFGVQAQGNAIVKDLTWDGTTYTFADAPASATTSNVLETDIAADESIYAGWHQGATNTGVAGKDEVRNNGLNLIDRSQVIKGYTNNNNTFDSKNITLFNAIKGGAFEVGTGTASFQIPMFVKDSVTGNPVFTTLRIDKGVGVHTFSVLDQWTSSKAVNGIAKDVPTQMSDIIDAFGDYKVIAFGVYGQTGTNVVKNITWDGTKYNFANTQPTAGTVTANVRGGNPSSSVVVTLVGNDAETPANVTYSVATPANGTATVVPGAGNENKYTYKPTAGYSGTDTFNYTVTDGRGGSTNGTVAVTVAANSAPVIIANTALTTRTNEAVTTSLTTSDANSDAVTLAVSQAAAHGTAVLGAGGVTYTPTTGFAGTDTFKVKASDTFGGSSEVTITVTVAANKPPVAAPITGNTVPGQPAAINLPATDSEGDPLTYVFTATGGTVSGTGATRTFTPAVGFAGTAVVTYTVTDGRGGSSTGTITFTVAKLASAVDIYRVKPVSGKITTRNTVSVYAAVTIAGKPAVQGTVVDVFAKGKKVGTGTVNSSGKVKATLKSKLPRGKSTLKIVLPDSSTVTGSSDSVKVTVKVKKK